jgi:hypothetical protein
VTTREPEWDPDQQALILALAQHRREECDQCGGYLPETTDSANEGRYEVVGPFLCHSCEALGRTRAGFAQSREKNPVYNMNRWSSRLRKG